MTKHKAYPIVWAAGRVLFSDLRGIAKKDWFGICGYSKRVFKIAPLRDVLTIMVVQNLYVGEHDCEEGSRCLDFDCPLNITTRESYAKSMNISPKKLPENFRATISYNRGPEGTLHSFGEFIEGQPAGTILIASKKH